MLFNSWIFAAFFLVVYGLYLRFSFSLQNKLLLGASLLFYGVWSWKFLLLLLLTTAIDFMIGRKLGETAEDKPRRFLLALSILSNLTILGFFKYVNFFSGNLQGLLGMLHIPVSLPVLNVVLPVGISFYTFQAMSYTIDVYRRDLQPIKKFSDFVLFVCFFPQLVAGPIERATHLVPQILSPRTLTYEKFYEGFYLFFWGLFQKIVIADQLARLVEPVFSASQVESGAHVLLAVYAFSFQILCDFSGYSDMARGLGKMMGFDIMLNFNLPYFSKTPSEFWQRWHISLSQWLRDYLYIPLGGNRNGSFQTFRNLFLVMLLGGLWHGAAWNFVLWGAFHGMLLIVYKLFEKPRSSAASSPNSLISFFQTVFFFHLVCLGWLFFRAKSLPQIGMMLKSLFFNFHFFELFQFPGWERMTVLIGLLMAAQILQFQKGDLLALRRIHPVLKWTVYALIFHLMLDFGSGAAQQFIYFQF